MERKIIFILDISFHKPVTPQLSSLEQHKKEHDEKAEINAAAIRVKGRKGVDGRNNTSSNTMTTRAEKEAKKNENQAQVDASAANIVAHSSSHDKPKLRKEAALPPPEQRVQEEFWAPIIQAALPWAPEQSWMQKKSRYI